MEYEKIDGISETVKQLCVNGRYMGRPANNEGRSEVEINTYNFLDSLGVSYET